MTEQLLTELKQYCFALYIGQKVQMQPERSKPMAVNPNFITPYWLQLRPLSSITDQEANFVYDNILKGLYPDNRSVKIKKLEIIDFIKGKHGWTISIKIIQLYQYLQQQGFALPVYFKGVQYSVEQLVELNIIQLQP